MGWFDPKHTLDSSGIHVHKTNGSERERERVHVVVMVNGSHLERREAERKIF